MSKRNLVLALVAIALMFSFVGVKDAGADSVLVPAFRADGNFVTVITAVNKDYAALAPYFHWVFRYNDPTTTPATVCEHFDGWSKTSIADYVSFDVSGNISSGHPLPDGADTTSGQPPIMHPKAYGWMTVSNFDALLGAALPENSLDVEVDIADITTGMVYAYRAPNDPATILEGNFDDIGWGSMGSHLNKDQQPVAVWHPTAIVNTEFYVLPVIANMNATTPAAAFVGDPNNDGMVTAVVRFATADSIPGFWYDINETPWSTSKQPTVNCGAFLQLSDLIDPAGLPYAANGGWAKLVMVTPTPYSKHNKGILVYKLENTTALGGTSSAWTSENRIDY